MNDRSARRATLAKQHAAERQRVDGSGRVLWIYASEVSKRGKPVTGVRKAVVSRASEGGGNKPSGDEPNAPCSTLHSNTRIHVLNYWAGMNHQYFRVTVQIGSISYLPKSEFPPTFQFSNANKA